MKKFFTVSLDVQQGMNGRIRAGSGCCGRIMLWAIMVLSIFMVERANAQPCPGRDDRAIAALSQERMASLFAGQGLGYAKAAELNGWPGPLHALELADQLSLDRVARAKVEAIRREMLGEARRLGSLLVESERSLNAQFTSGTANEESIKTATAVISKVEAQLRAVHLIAHLRVTPILTHRQRRLYASLRGYDGDRHGHGNH